MTLIELQHSIIIQSDVKADLGNRPSTEGIPGTVYKTTGGIPGTVYKTTDHLIYCPQNSLWNSLWSYWKRVFLGRKRGVRLPA